MNTFSHVPPGFRFHPTDEELVDYYLRKKVASKRIDLDFIKDVDLYKIEPWDLQGINIPIFSHIVSGNAAFKRTKKKPLLLHCLNYLIRYIFIIFVCVDI